MQGVLLLSLIHQVSVLAAFEQLHGCPLELSLLDLLKDLLLGLLRLHSVDFILELGHGLGLLGSKRSLVRHLGLPKLKLLHFSLLLGLNV